MADQSDADIDSLVDATLDALRPQIRELAERAFAEGRKSGGLKRRRHGTPVPTIRASVLEALRSNERGLTLQQIVPYVRAKQGAHAASSESIRVTLHKMAKDVIERREGNRWGLKKS